MATKAELEMALEGMLAAFGPGSFNMEKGDALRRARIALGKALPWELRRKHAAGPLKSTADPE